MDLLELVASPHLRHSWEHRAAYMKRLRSLAAAEAQDMTAALLLRRRRLAAIKHAEHVRRIGGRTGPAIFTESKELGEMDVEGGLDTMDQHENVMDVGGETVDHADPGPSLHDTQDGSRTQHSLGTFFERPVSIFDSTFLVDTEYNIPLSVWDLWSSNPAVRAKLSNYAFFKGNLHVKVSVSGTPFHYGRLMLSYQPYPTANGTLVNYDTLFANPTTLRDVVQPYKCYTSQAPGVYYIDIKENEPVTVDIPFISYKQMFRLFNSNNSVITNATSFDDFAEAGELRLITLNAFKVANEDLAAEASINVYAWATDVELGCITGTDINIVAESSERGPAKSKTANTPPKKGGGKAASPKKKGGGGPTSKKGGGGGASTSRASGADEYQSAGPVELVASAVGTIGTVLSDFPVIGPFARATATMANAAGAVAQMFGWSKPVVLEPAVYVKNNPFQNGATLAVHDTALRITCDPKQELSVDQSVGGVWGDDDMAIPVIAARESFLTTFPWSNADTAMTTRLWAGGIGPNMRNYGVLGAGALEGILYQSTPLDFATRPFAYWRGTIRLRFEVVCSKFHRGKLLFRYEPNVPQDGLIASSSAQLNQMNTAILDLQEAQDITFDIAWAHPRAWARVPAFDPGVSTTNVATQVVITGSAQTNPTYDVVAEPFYNGVIEVRPINELVQPSDDATVSVNVYVSCPDLQVAYPVSNNIALDKEIVYTESNEVTLNETGATMDCIHEEHFGEKIVSFRALLKRFFTAHALSESAASNVYARVIVAGSHFPRYLNPPLGSSTANSAGGGFAHLFDYLRGGYMAMRGGMRHRVLPFELNPNAFMSEKDYVRVTMADPGLSETAYNEPSIFAETTNASTFYSRADGTLTAELSGSLTYHLASNGGVEFETPFYSNNLFTFANAGDEGASVVGFEPFYSSRWFAAYGNATRGDGGEGVLFDYATGEDFTFLRFQGAPYFVSE